MDFLKVSHSPSLQGNIQISGAKNAALPLLCLSILSKKNLQFTNVPEVADIRTLIKLLKNLGASVTLENNEVNINTQTLNNTKAVYDIVRRMRASVLVLGPLLARFRHCEVSLPGGCAIGQRPIDLHLKALEALGAVIKIEDGYISAKAPNGLTGCEVVFDKVTVGGCENIIMAAALAKGKTAILNAAREPEVVQLCEALIDAGVKITGAGTNCIEIEGTNAELIDFKPIKVIPDRIEAGTYLCAGAITNSTITIEKVQPKHLSVVLSKLKEMGFGIEIQDDHITLLKASEIMPVEITTAEYPGFPTDLQAQFMVVLTQAKGASSVCEKLFENRFMHVSELNRLGAEIHLNGNMAMIYPTPKLQAADVMATDLRASSALILAALVARGQTTIHRIYHLDRGYENLEQKFKTLGVNVVRGRENA